LKALILEQKTEIEMTVLTNVQNAVKMRKADSVEPAFQYGKKENLI
jgi:hypothetical protein